MSNCVEYHQSSFDDNHQTQETTDFQATTYRQHDSESRHPTTAIITAPAALYFDPYSPADVQVSLLDNDDNENNEDHNDFRTNRVDHEHEPALSLFGASDSAKTVIRNRLPGSFSSTRTTIKQMASIPGTVGLLEMEDPEQHFQQHEILFYNEASSCSSLLESTSSNDPYLSYLTPRHDPRGGAIQTDSGLLLTHSCPPAGNIQNDRSRSGGNNTPWVRSRHVAASSSSSALSSSSVPSSSSSLPIQLGQKSVESLELEHERYRLPPMHNNSSTHNDAQYYSLHHHPRRSSFPTMHGNRDPLHHRRYFGSSSQGNATHLLHRWLSMARVWVIISAILLCSGMTVVVKHIRHESSSTSTSSAATTAKHDTNKDSRVVSYLPNPDSAESMMDAHPDSSIPDRIILLPLPDTFLPDRNDGHDNIPWKETSGHHHYYHQQQQEGKHHNSQHRHLLPNPLKERQGERVKEIKDATVHHHHLHDSFLQWKQTHDKKYSSRQEHVERFHIWQRTHERIQRKNEQHGPCKLTAQPVFGMNHFSDLTTDEFQRQYLSGYGLARHRVDVDHSSNSSSSSSTTATYPHSRTPPVLDPNVANSPFASPDPNLRNQHINRRRMTDIRDASAKQTNWQSCDWYDVSCILRYIFETYFYGLGRTMEPAYDYNSYPLKVDWREMGAVTEVHSQGNCGACWAITAVETVESAYYLSNKQLLDLSETEVIVCTDDSEWCNGGWPQSAFEYIMNHKGIPLETDLPYSADALLALTEIKDAGDQNGAISSYMQAICPSGKGNGGGKSGDNNKNNNNDGNNGNSLSRYGNIKGYGYATERCICYSDGSGCDCDTQNEGLAVRNVATYGPAVVCVDASTWQDYNGGIMTTQSGCSSKFLDVNHCVQVVGYAFATASEGGQEGQQRNSGSGDRGGGSKDNEERYGYWIVRNQWSTYWGMSGFAYVAMGENTCGILNDMIQVYS